MATAKKRSPGQPVDQLVVLGASAGGIEAVSVVLSDLPSDFPAPIVVAQHLHPDHHSNLPEILSRQTDLRVVSVEEEVKLEAATVYLVPPNRHVEITDHAVRLQEFGGDRPKPSIDHLLATAAETFGERLVAVILSGTGSDGAAGAEDVAAAGGTVIAQDPDTATFPSMPRSLSRAIVDAVRPLEQIGALLVALVTGERTLKADDDERLSRFLETLRDRSGVDFTSYKQPTVLRRIQRRMIATGSDGLAEYRRHLLRNPDEIHRLTSSLLIKVTQFFRDPELFDHLRDHVLPRLIEEAEESERELRLWSAGCATGEEAYSLAMLMSDITAERGMASTVRIFATDADPEAIATARRGVYPASAVRGLDPETVRRHFDHVDGEYEVRPNVRSLVVFGEHDLGHRAPFPRIDLVMCRNVLIYFTGDLQRRALRLFTLSLRPDGVLVLGKSESTSAFPDGFRIADERLRIYRRSLGSVPISSEGLREATVLDVPRLGPQRRRFVPEQPLSLADHQALPATGAERAQSILLRLPVGVCLVDRSYDLLSVNTAARSMLGIHGTAIGGDFVHHARALDSSRLREAIDRAFRGDPVREVFRVTSETPIGESRIFDVDFRPVSLGARNRPSVTDAVMITLSDVTDATLEREAMGENVSRGSAELERLEAQVLRVMETNHELLRGNEELAVANAELRTANEELLIYNEELQASAEEVETLNEELQATNEELETVNEELQATVEELNTTSEDLSARMAAAEAGDPIKLSTVRDRSQRRKDGD